MQLEFDQVSARHPAARVGAPAALRSASIVVARGEQVAVIGPSGAGKTTLLHVAAAALAPQSGRVVLDGVDPWTAGASGLRALRQRLFLAPQVPPLPPRQRVVTSVLAGRLPTMSLAASVKSLFYPHDIPAAHAALARFDIDGKLFDRVDRLSGGERQRVGLARALLSPASLWLIDEPLSALDPTRARQAIDTLLSVAAERGVALVATLHQVDVALERFARIVGLRAGEVAFDLPAARVTPPMLQQLYGDEFETLDEPAVAEPFDATEPPHALPIGAVRCR
jgi:phosphonate transport system ATP-binding protein